MKLAILALCGLALVHTSIATNCNSCRSYDKALNPDQVTEDYCSTPSEKTPRENIYAKTGDSGCFTATGTISDVPPATTKAPATKEGDKPAADPDFGTSVTVRGNLIESINFEVMLGDAASQVSTKNCDEVKKNLQDKLNIKLGGFKPAKQITFECVECTGDACNSGSSLQVGILTSLLTVAVYFLRY